MLLGINQGLAWSTTVIMKIDLVGPARRGLAMGLNEFAGYFAVALAALATGYIAAAYGLRPEPFYLGVAFAVVGLALSALLRARDARPRRARGATLRGASRHAAARAELTIRQIFALHELARPGALAVSQAGLVNNLNDGMAWGLFPLFFAAAGLSVGRIGVLGRDLPGRLGARRSSSPARSPTASAARG